MTLPAFSANFQTPMTGSPPAAGLIAPPDQGSNAIDLSKPVRISPPNVAAVWFFFNTDSFTLPTSQSPSTVFSITGGLTMGQVVAPKGGEVAFDVAIGRAWDRITHGCKVPDEEIPPTTEGCADLLPPFILDGKLPSMMRVELSPNSNMTGLGACDDESCSTQLWGTTHDLPLFQEIGECYYSGKDNPVAVCPGWVYWLEVHFVDIASPAPDEIQMTIVERETGNLDAIAHVYVASFAEGLFWDAVNEPAEVLWVGNNNEGAICFPDLDEDPRAGVYATPAP